MIQHPREAGLAAALAALLLLALFGPPIAQPEHYHVFADRRTFAGIPFAMDVLTNLAFAAWGVAGIRRLARLVPGAIGPARALGAGMFFRGLTATALGSAAYHAQPTDAGLALDRVCMVWAYSGLLVLAAAERVSARSGLAMAVGAPPLGCLSVAVWAVSGNVLAWALFQFGGMALLACGALLRPVEAGPAVRWIAVLALYAAAKGCEMADESLYALSGSLVSGHSLKHLVASCAAWPVLHTLQRAGRLARKAPS
ncbi:MAG: hypothetical protein Fur0039_08490 [Rhodocyclaceae bacterium]